MSDSSANQPATSLLAPHEVVLFMGRPGAGKGTHAAILAAEYGLVAASTGDLMRRMNDPVIAGILAEGKLVPESDLERVLMSALKDLEGVPVILDGATKKPNEARWLLQEALPALGRTLVAVIYLTIDEAVARRRITIGNRGRTDDAHHLQDVRSREFNEYTLASIEYYRQAGLVTEVASDRPSSVVNAQIVSAIRAARS